MAPPARGSSPRQRQLPLQSETRLPRGVRFPMEVHCYTWTLEDNQAVIKVVQKGRAPAFRHLHSTRRINLDLICETCQFEYVELKNV
eukprot:1763040-Pyramimonas_sp.AAC.1